MATYTQNMSLQSGGNLSGNKPLGDAGATRMINAWREIFGMSPGSTPQQVWTAMVEHTYDYLKTRAMNYERALAQEAIDVDDIV